MFRFLMLSVCCLSLAFPGLAQREPPYAAELERLVSEVSPQVVAWRRDIHQHPELGNREMRTSALVAEHLRSLGLDEVRTGVAHTGVVGVLRGGRPGKVVALRADMDALPVKELVDVPFASQVRTTYNGQDVGVMHACGHDVHTAVLMGTASVLAAMREQLPGTVLFIFQPAEEGPPPGEEGGARLMLKEGLFDDPQPDAVFGLHTWPVKVGTLGYRPGGTMAGSDRLEIDVTGVQTHGAVPWAGVDPIVAASQIVLGLQTLVSRQVDVTTSPTVVTIGTIHGGVRYNIIPDKVELRGTIRVLNPAMRDDLLQRIERTATNIAAAQGAKAEVRVFESAPVTYNDPELTKEMVPTLQRAAPEGAVVIAPLTPAEDFAYYQREVPGVYFFLGIAPPDEKSPAPNHSPYFFVDESAIPIGVRAMASMAMDYLAGFNEVRL